MTTKTTLLCIAVMIILFGVAVVKVGVPRVEKAECLKWQHYSKIYPDWYATEWQVEQCLNYGIDLN
jgi:hypothetical protein